MMSSTDHCELKIENLEIQLSIKLERQEAYLRDVKLDYKTVVFYKTNPTGSYYKAVTTRLSNMVTSNEFTNWLVN